MARFFIVDQSLDGVGGHHFDTVRLISQAASDQGFEVIAGTHRKFSKQHDGVFSAAQVKPVFRNSTYTPFSQLGALREMTRSRYPLLGGSVPRGKLRRHLIRPWQRRVVERSQRRIICDFATDCDKLFRPLLFSDGDQVLFMTVNDLDFLGLAAYLSHEPATIHAQWKVVFHFGILPTASGGSVRKRDYFERIRYSMQSALARIPYHQVEFLASTEELADEYNQLKVGHFRMLPYPIEQSMFDGGQARSLSNPVNITLAGGLRREKGKREIRQVAEKISSLNLPEVDVRLNVQVRGRNRLGSLWRRVPKSGNAVASMINLLPHPLPEDEYQRLINRTDIGLLLYDHQKYFARRAGILCEYLTAGCPVVVPAGCWLSQQLAEPSFRHCESLIENRGVSGTKTISDLQHNPDNVPQSGGVLSFDRLRYPFELQGRLEHSCAALAIQFDWHWSQRSSAFAQIETEAVYADGSREPIDMQIIGRRRQGGKSGLIVPLARPCQAYRISIVNAFQDSAASIKNFGITEIGAWGQRIPRSSVGCSFASYGLVPAAIQEVIDNYPHYARTAAKFSHYWSRRHDPEFTLDFLMGNRSEIRFAA